ncbi:MAG TPA: AMP-binding protein [Nocardioidaceae bacterium]|nr:AMP-binding protein [Nocardioidaceae bacterium]
MLRLQDIAGLTVGDVLARNAQTYGDQVAMVWQGEAATWHDLDAAVTRLAAGLAELGVVPGEPVAIWLPNRPEVVHTYFAVARLGAIVVPLNPALTAEEAADLLADSGAVAVVLSSQHAAALPRLTGSERPAALRHLVSVDDLPGTTPYAELASGQAQLPAATVSSGAPVVIYYTSGTTGKPKGAMHSHFSVLATAVTAAGMMDLTSDDRVLLCTPLYHSAAMHTFLMSHLLVGGSWVVTGGFDPHEVLEVIARDRVTIYFGVVPMLIATLAVPDLAHRDTSSLRIVFTGASPVPQTLKQECIAAFPHADLIDGYGFTESGPSGTALHKSDALDHPGSVGKPWPYIQIAVQDTATGEAAPPGATGEILIRSPGEMIGYLHRAQATAEVFAGGWLHTGDLGHLDADGFCYITGRAKDMLIRGGVNIYPREIEEVLHTHPAVSEAAVFGVEDARMGEEVMACVILRAGAHATAEELLAHAEPHLAHFKRPCYVQVVEDLPRNATGKVLKYRLRQTYRDEDARGPRLHRRREASGVGTGAESLP